MITPTETASGAPVRAASSISPPSRPIFDDASVASLVTSWVAMVTPIDDEHERTGGGDEDEVDQLRARSRSALDVHRSLETRAQRGHHSSRRPGEDDERQKAQGAGRAGDLRDRALDVSAALVAHRQPVDDRVDHVLAHLVVLEHEAEHRDEDDGERRQREQDPVGDRRRVLPEPMGEVAVDRLGDDGNELPQHTERRAQEAHGPRPGVGRRARRPSRASVRRVIACERRAWPACRARGGRRACTRARSDPARGAPPGRPACRG